MLLPLPVPLGVPLIGLGLVLGVSGSRRLAGAVRLLRRRHEPADRALGWIEIRLSGHAFAALRRTGRRSRRTGRSPDI